MNAQDLERLETRIKAAESTQAKAEGAMGQIADRWERDLGTRDPEEVAAILAAEEKRLQTLQGDFDAAVSDAQALIDKAGA